MTIGLKGLSLVEKCAIVATYPVTGNLPGGLKEKIERAVPAFSSEAATVTSHFTNFFVYTPVFAMIAYSSYEPPFKGPAMVLATIGGAFLGIAEGFLRAAIDERIRENREIQRMTAKLQGGERVDNDERGSRRFGSIFAEAVYMPAEAAALYAANGIACLKGRH